MMAEESPPLGQRRRCPARGAGKAAQRAWSAPEHGAQGKSGTSLPPHLCFAVISRPVAFYHPSVNSNLLQQSSLQTRPRLAAWAHGVSAGLRGARSSNLSGSFPF